MSGSSLEAELRARGHACRVDAQDRLAVIVPEEGLHRALSSALRDDALGRAAAHGFTHVALEIPGAPHADAPLSRH